MDLYLIIFTSDTTFRAEQTYNIHKELFMALEKYFTLHLVYYKEADHIPPEAYKMAFIGSGEVEDKVIGSLSALPYPITLLTDGINNSLGAALEISANISAKNLRVTIIHNEAGRMAEQVLTHYKAFAAKHTLRGKRIGVIGTPAPWLVASHVDYLLASQRWGVSYIDIPMKEVYKRFYEITDEEIGLEASVLANKAQACQDTTPEELLRAMRLYKAVRQICNDEKLSAVALSCMSLIHQLNTTGCVALSLLNNEGIPAGCEGDLQAVTTMLMAHAITGQPSFMGNLSFVDSQHNEILLAHCSAPTCMTERFFLRNHFDKRAGVAIQGQMHEGDITLFKCGGECLDEYYVSEGVLTENTNLVTTCRTQFKLKMQHPVSYFLDSPLGNHHILLQGQHATEIQEFMRQNHCKARQK